MISCKSFVAICLCMALPAFAGAESVVLNTPALSPRMSAVARTALEHITVVGAIEGINATPATVALNTPDPILKAIDRADIDAPLRACGLPWKSKALSVYPDYLRESAGYTPAQALYLSAVYRLAIEDTASRMKRAGDTDHCIVRKGGGDEG